MVLHKRIPKATGKRCMESMGWLITVGDDEGEINLLHPFSGVQFELPHQNTTENYDNHATLHLMTFFQKAVLSGSPHTSDYILMVIEGDIDFLSFWRPGDLRWTRIEEQTPQSTIGDVVHFNGHFYAFDFFWPRDVDGPEPTKTHIVAQQPFGPRDPRDKLYILESLGSLFVVVRVGGRARHVKDDYDRIPLTFIPVEGVVAELTYGTTDFQVFQVDLASGKVTRTKELGDRSFFFLGANASISVQASQFPGIKPNHIYFTDDYWETYLHYEEGGGLDMGVFSLADGSIQPHYKGVSLSHFCPPIWVTPTLC
uniref:F-box/kelch-repeat protein At3g18720-like n=1 Tax=Nicotiana tabacum TaxID=4097 RepID=A0A1S4C7Z8_TOBAC|nr:PREDICTED: F-box/kelch-repeat protein At3g18720-like [Nicotiana tabacum]